jgi:hypothetical protein
MALRKLVFCESKTQVRSLSLTIEADTDERAAELAEEAYARGEYDAALEAAEPDTSECETWVGASQPNGSLAWIY